MTCQILHVHKSVSDETLKEFAQGHNATGQIWGSSGPGKGSCHCRALPSRRQNPRAKLPVPVSFPNINLPPPVSWESHHPLLLPRPGSQYRNAQGSAVCLVIWEGDHSCTPTPLRSAAKSLSELLRHLYLSRAAPMGQSAASLWRLVNQQESDKILALHYLTCVPRKQQ